MFLKASSSDSAATIREMVGKADMSTLNLCDRTWWLAHLIMQRTHYLLAR